MKNYQVALIILLIVQALSLVNLILTKNILFLTSILPITFAIILLAKGEEKIK